MSSVEHRASRIRRAAVAALTSLVLLLGACPESGPSSTGDGVAPHDRGGAGDQRTDRPAPDSGAPDTAVVDLVAPADLPLPDLPPPDLPLPDLPLPDLPLPDLPPPDLAAPDKSMPPDLTPPDSAVPDVPLPDLPLPDLPLPDLPLPDLPLPDLPLPDLPLPDLPLPDLPLPDLPLPDLPLPDLLPPDLLPPDSKPLTGAQVLVQRLDAARFKGNVATLVGFGSRYWAAAGNGKAAKWLEQQLASYGYAVQQAPFSYKGQSRYSVYVTKVGTTNPDKMYIVGAHFDSYNTQSSGSAFAPGADDNASGSSLVLEAARVFGAADIQTAYSVRFIIFNNEETGLNGAKAYVSQRRLLQGVEQPPGSGKYPEPTWLGMIQHDMILFDHGVPAAAKQSPNADIDIEYQAKYSYSGKAITLANSLLTASKLHSTDYPAEVGANMGYTDSVAFQSYCPAVSVRENRRVSEIGKGGNPHWHKSSDVVATYSAADFLLGFNAVQMTVGAVADLAQTKKSGP